MELDYRIVDVFTDTPLQGNPLAVVLDAASLATEQMQAIALEFNLSETTFIQRRPPEIERAEGVRVRIFTTQEELPFAGHPTLGTAGVLLDLAPEIAENRVIALALKVGRILVQFDPVAAGSHVGSRVLFGEMTQRDPEFGGELDAADVARLAGLNRDDLYPELPPQIVSTGNPFAIVPLRSLDALARLAVRHKEASEWLLARGARWFYALAPEPDADAAATQRWRARMQFYGGEDPATGSAAGPAIAYLVARGVVSSDQRIHLRQGVEIGRSSDLFLRARLHGSRVTDVRVAGSTVPVAMGRLFLP